jgi:hypothetical protein
MKSRKNIENTTRKSKLFCWGCTGLSGGRSAITGLGLAAGSLKIIHKLRMMEKPMMISTMRATRLRRGLDFLERAKYTMSTNNAMGNKSNI